MGSVTANECSPEKWVWVLNLMKYKTRVRVNWDIEFSKHTYKLSENVAALVETLTEDMGMDLFDLSEVGTAMENRDEV